MIQQTKKGGQALADKIYRYRFLIGALIVLLAVAFHISGSSIGMWAEYLPGAKRHRAAARNVAFHPGG